MRIVSQILSLAIVALGFCHVETSEANAQSLFERRSSNQIDQYRDYVARNKGDLLSILISEATDVENRDERSLDKTGNTSSNADVNYGFGGGLGSALGNATFGEATSNSRGFSGDTEFRSERAFSDKFAVTVVDVLPSGDLVVSGHRKISVQGDVRELRLTGVVRQFDILPNNMVPSHLVGNLKIELSAAGAEQAFSKQGWLSRRMNKLWPY